MKLTIKERVVRRLEGIKEDFRIREIFKHKGRTCVIIEIHMGPVGNWHNGYVETIKKIVNKRYAENIDTDDVTFSGSLYDISKKNGLKGKKFLGFDSGHYWNIKNQKSQTFREVKERTIRLCEKMIIKGI